MISSLKSLLFAISAFFGPVALSCQTKLIVVDNLRESILSCIFWLIISLSFVFLDCFRETHATLLELEVFGRSFSEWKLTVHLFVRELDACVKFVKR